MIYIERTIEIKKNNAKIEEPIILYKGDRNIEIQFTIENNPFKYRSGVDLTYGQLVIKRPEADPIFSDVAKLSNSKVLFVVSGDMIDDLTELGNYDFQIRLINSDKTSRGTLPPVFAGIIIKAPVCEEEGVNYSVVNYSKAATGETLDVFDENGDYIKTTWISGDIITDSRLNKIENALYEINNDEVDLSNYYTETEINGLLSGKADVTHNHDTIYYRKYLVDAKINALSIDSYAKLEDLITWANLKADKNHTHEGYATETFVTNKIAEAQLDGGDVDLSGYATKEHTHNEYITETELNSKGYATKTYVDDMLGDIESLLGGI